MISCKTPIACNNEHWVIASPSVNCLWIKPRTRTYSDLGLVTTGVQGKQSRRLLAIGFVQGSQHCWGWYWDNHGSPHCTISPLDVSISIAVGLWHFNIACTDRWSRAHRAFAKNMAAPSKSQGLVNNKSYKKRNRCYWGYLKKCIFMYVLILFSIWPIALWIFSYKKRSCPLRSFSAHPQRLQISTSSVSSKNCRSSLL